MHASCRAILCRHLITWRFQGWCNHLFVYSSFKAESFCCLHCHLAEPGRQEKKGGRGTGSVRGRQREKGRQRHSEREERDRGARRAPGGQRGRRGASRRGLGQRHAAEPARPQDPNTESGRERGEGRDGRRRRTRPVPRASGTIQARAGGQPRKLRRSSAVPTGF